MGGSFFTLMNVYIKKTIVLLSSFIFGTYSTSFHVNLTRHNIENVKAAEIIASGDYGLTKEDDVHWKMDSEYTLTFYGTGEMKKVSRQIIDWSDAKN